MWDERYSQPGFAYGTEPNEFLAAAAGRIPAGGAVLSLGEGEGRNAAYLAGLGHRVVAVEPTTALRQAAIALHPSPLIEWLDDSLPELALIRARDERFDVVMLTRSGCTSIAASAGGPCRTSPAWSRPAGC